MRSVHLLPEAALRLRRRQFIRLEIRHRFRTLRLHEGGVCTQRGQLSHVRHCDATKRTSRQTFDDTRFEQNCDATKYKVEHSRTGYTRIQKDTTKHDATDHTRTQCNTTQQELYHTTHNATQHNNNYTTQHTTQQNYNTTHRTYNTQKHNTTNNITNKNTPKALKTSLKWLSEVKQISRQFD